MEIDYNNMHAAAEDLLTEADRSNQNQARSFRILPNMKPSDVDPILEAYQTKYATADNPKVVTQHQGEPSTSPTMPTTIHQTRQNTEGREPEYPSRQDLIKSCRMKPKHNKFFVVNDPDLDDIILFLLGNERRGLLEEKDWENLGKTDSDYNQLVKRTKELLTVDFSPLQQPRYDYENQKEISKERIDQADACLLHYGGEIGMLVRFLGGEYTAENRDVEGILTAVKPHIDERDYEDMKRILYDGCPFSLSKHFSKKNKMNLLKQGNQKSVNENREAVIKTMNKEEQHSHLISLSSMFCRFSAFCHHVRQGMNMKKPESPRVVWDGTNKKNPLDEVMNEDVDMENEPIITFGNTKREFMSMLYNTRVSYPNDEIWIASADIKACFRWPRIHPDLCGAFSFVIDFMGMLCATTAMVFGFIASANCWEPFRRAIEVMTAVIFERIGSDSNIHQEYIDMFEFEDLPSKDESNDLFTKAKPCSINTGVLDNKGKQKPIGTKIYVDDCLLVAVWMHFLQLLRAVIEAIFTVTGFPNTAVRQCTLAMDKWIGMKVSYKAILLGLIWNARALTVGITEEYRAELLALLNKTWHKARKSFTIHELEVLVGKCARLGEGANWVFHLMTHMYASTAFALKSNASFLGQRSKNFVEHLKKIKELRKAHQHQTREDMAVINFSIKKAAQQLHRCDNEYFIPKTMRREIEFLREALHPNSGIKWATPIGHLIPRDPTAEGCSDACLEAGGGFSMEMRFIWFLTWPTDILYRTKKFLKNDRDGNFVSINVLEFISVILEYCAALTVIETEDFTDDPWPVFLARCDNKSGVRWISHACMNSEIGRELGRFFCALLIDSRLGINAKWLSTIANKIADDISRLKKQNIANNPTSNHPFIDYQSLFQSHPQLQDCRRWIPNEELLSCIWQIVRTKNCPELEEIRKLRRKGLGKLSGLDGWNI